MNTLLTFAQSTYDYTTTTTGTNIDEATVVAVTAAVFLFTIIFVAIAYIVSAIFLGKIFKKAGIPAWIAWVPFYNNYKLLEIGGQPGYWAILAIIPGVSIVTAIFMYISMYHIGLKFGKEATFVLWAIFLPLVWMIWLAVDKSTWNNTLGAPSKAPEHLNSAANPTA